MTEAELFLSAAALLVFVLTSNRLKDRGVTAAMAFALYGVLMGPLGLGWIHVSVSDKVIEGLATLTLVLTLFTDAIRIDVGKLRREHDMPLRMLGIGLPLTILAGVGVAMALFPGLTVWEAALLAVILAPTDAALGQQVMKNKEVPQRVRQALNVESGLNDGLGLPILLFVASMATLPGTGPERSAPWGLYLGEQLLLGPLAGVVLGLVGAVAVAWARDHDWLNEAHLRLAVLGLGLLSYTGGELVGGNGFIATFFCGLVIAHRSPKLQKAAQSFESSAGELFNLTIFLIFGAALLPEFLAHITWDHVLFTVFALTILRMGPVALSLLGMGLMPSTLAVLGWFGPRGMASIIYLLLVNTRYQVPGLDDIGATVVLTILVSIVLHGLTALPLSHRYAQRVARVKGAEARPCSSFPTR